MTSKEKRLYHQIHPAKLGVDVSTSLITTYLAWRHDLVWFLVLFLAPSVLISWLLVTYADLEPLQRFRLGAYVAKSMTPFWEVVRAIGQLAVWAAAWFRMPVGIVVGYLIIIVAWLNGRLFHRSAA